jgi:hypothetical protein
MRFSTLALFIALPAAAYAAAATPNDKGNTQENTVSNPAKVNDATPVNAGSCIQQTVGCVIDSPSPNCCSGLQCKPNSNGVPVCFIAYLVRFTLCTELNAAMPPAGEFEVGRGIPWIRRMSRSYRHGYDAGLIRT